MANGTPIRIHDILDADAFVGRCIHTSGILIPQDERADLHAEGMLILWELSVRYEEQRPGYNQPGRFSGYAAAFLPKRLQDAWLRMHPEHLVRRGPDGRRQVTYGTSGLSIETDELPQMAATYTVNALAEHLAEDHPVHHSALLTSALADLPLVHRRGGYARRMLELVDSGVICTDTIAHELQIDRRDVLAIQGAVASSIHRQQRAQAA